MVQEFADQQIIEIYQCREALKKALNRAIQAKHPLKLSETNSIFHNIIVSYAINSRLQSLLGLFNDVIMRDRNVIAYSAERPEQIHAEHATILEALADGDGEPAEAAMRLHVRKGLEFISRRVQDRRVQDAEREE